MESAEEPTVEDEVFEEPKLCCYKKRFIASRALIWSLVSIGATFFSIGYVLKVFTAHYPDDQETASIFEISGITLVSVGAGLTGIGIIACFHSCCVVLCYRPVNKPANRSESQKSTSSNASQKPLPPPPLAVNQSYDYTPSYTINQQQQQPLLPQNSVPRSFPMSRTPPPERCTMPPKLFPNYDDSVVIPSNQLRENDKRRHQSQGNVNKSIWDEYRFAVIPDRSPEAGKNAHPYNDDFLHQQLRKKMAAVAYTAANQVQKPPRNPPKPSFRTGNQVGSYNPVISQNESLWQRQSGVPKSPRGDSSSASRQRQYFHEEHFTFSDLEPDDAFNEPQPRQSKSSTRSYGTPKSRRHHSSNTNIVADTRTQPFSNIPATSNNINATPVNTIQGPTPFVGHLIQNRQPRFRQQASFAGDADAVNSHVIFQSPISGGSPSSGRFSEHYNAHPSLHTSLGIGHQQSGITMPVPSPHATRRASPANQRRFASDFHNVMPENPRSFSDFSNQAPAEIVNLRLPDGTYKVSQLPRQFETIATSTGNLNFQGHYANKPVDIAEGGFEADYQMTEAVFPTPKKSPKCAQGQLVKNVVFEISDNLPSPSYVNVTDRASTDPRLQSIISSAHESQAFLCEQEEII